MPKLPLTEMRAQILELCAQNYISIVFVKPYQAVEAVYEDRQVCILPIKSTISYVTALHEIGHLVDKQSLRYHKDDLACEAHAWKYAEKQAIVWNPTAKKHRDQCLRLYLKQEKKKPEKSHIFWQVYKKD